jgi:hypothetical protein
MSNAFNLCDLFCFPFHGSPEAPQAWKWLPDDDHPCNIKADVGKNSLKNSVARTASSASRPIVLLHNPFFGQKHPTFES